MLPTLSMRKRGKAYIQNVWLHSSIQFLPKLGKVISVSTRREQISVANSEHEKKGKGLLPVCTWYDDIVVYRFYLNWGK